MRPQTARAPRADLPVRVPHHDRGQRVHGHHPPGGRPAGGGAAECQVVPAGAEGARAGPVRRLVRLRRPGPRLHGRGPVDRPERPAAAGGPADLRSLGPRHRLPARPFLAGGARSQAGVHQPRVQPDPARLAPGPLLGRAVRVQGDTAGRGAGAAAARRGHRVVLRHRDAGARRARRAQDPRGAGRLGRRPRLDRPHREDGHRRPQGRVAGRQGPRHRVDRPRPARPPLRGRPPRPRHRGRAARPGPPTRSPCSSRRSPTRRPTGASPSASGAGPAPSGTRRRDWWCSASASPSPAARSPP